MSLINDEFLLSNEYAKCLYHNYAEIMPIVDYHCHISPEEIAVDKQFENITEIWLKHDHYKWRLMRQNGVEEKYITGNASDYDKFIAWVKTLENAIGNPIYHWSYLELKRYFDYDGELNSDTAKYVWDFCNKKIVSGDLNARKIIKMSNVKVIGTTDDPADDLKWHKQIAEDITFNTRVIPTFRPDMIFQIENKGFSLYIDKLGVVCNRTINNLNDLKYALTSRIDFFDSMGCKSSDHSFANVLYDDYSEKEVDGIFKRAILEQAITSEDKKIFESHMLRFLAAEYKKKNWVMQLHFGVIRNSNTRMFDNVGKDAGFDRILSSVSVEQLAKLFDSLDKTNDLPKVIIYSLNPNDNATIDVLCGCFNENGVRSKIQHGAAWWFNDHMTGMKNHLQSLCDLGMVANFVGMLTDSRSFLSYTRHEYFRRILCSFLADKVIRGELIWNEKLIGNIVNNIAYNNAVEYFNL